MEAEKPSEGDIMKPDSDKVQEIKRMGSIFGYGLTKLRRIQK